MKTTVRMSITLPENIARIQRLYDHDTYFKLDEEIITDLSTITTMVEQMKASGAKVISCASYISTDDLEEHMRVVYEYIPNYN